MLFLIYTLLTAPPPGEPPLPRALILPLEDRLQNAAELEKAQNEARAAGYTLVPHAQIAERLMGTPHPRTADLAEERQRLDWARTLEANFDTPEANVQRQAIIEAYDADPAPSPELRGLAVLALQEIAAAWLGDGREDLAQAAALELARRFPEHPGDPRRFPPPVLGLFKNARDTVALGPKGKVTIISSPGEVFIDGRSLGQSRGTVTRSVPIGTYRVWAVLADRVEGPLRLVVQADGESQAAPQTNPPVDLETFGCIGLIPVVHLRCPERWQSDLLALATWADAQRVVGVRGDGPNLVLDRHPASPLVADSTPSPPPPAHAAIPSFSPLYLIPFGGAQFAQDRPVFASLYLAATVGLGIWFGVTTGMHADVIQSRQIDREPELRTLRTISTGAFLGTVGLTLLEGIIYGLVAGE